jgi:hypothetical protein
MAAHHFICSRLMTLGDVWFCQHHDVHQLKLSVGAKGLRSSGTETNTLCDR